MSTNCPTSLWSGHSTTWLQPNFCANLYAGGPSNPLYKPRGLHIDLVTDEILLVERAYPTGARVIRLDENDASGGDAEIIPVAQLAGLNHGIELSNGYLYASSETTVYRWPYVTGQTTPGDSTNVQEVIVGMDRNVNDELGAPGGHTTRTLAFDAEGNYVYVSIGSRGNIDADSFRSRIRRFDVSAWDGITPLLFNDGEVFADGLRNEVGLAFDSHGDLWGVENGADNLYRDDLGGDIHNDNPGEELNRFRQDQAGEHWGYPYCWSEYCLDMDSGGSGVKGGNNTVWAWSSSNGLYNDEWCRENTQQSVLSMPAHSAPLGITFYKWNDGPQEGGCEGGFPKGMDKYAFIAYHGSWNRSPPTGYKVVFVPFDSEGNPTNLPIDLFRHGGESAKWSGSDIRPVDLQFDSCGRLFVTEDGTGSVIKISYGGSYFDDFVPIETDVADGASCSAAFSSTPPIPSLSPKNSLTSSPSGRDTKNPTDPPSSLPQNSSSRSPSKLPSSTPSANVTNKPTYKPTNDSTAPPTLSPGKIPSAFPIQHPTALPSGIPTETFDFITTDSSSGKPSQISSEKRSPLPSESPVASAEIPAGIASNDQITFLSKIPSDQPTIREPCCSETSFNEQPEINSAWSSRLMQGQLTMVFVCILYLFECFN